MHVFTLFAGPCVTHCHLLNVGSFNSVYKRYKIENNNPISLSTLRKNTPIQYKRARKQTDLCEYCEMEPTLTKRLKHIQQQEHESKDENEKKMFNMHIGTINDTLSFINHHKQIATQQRLTFQNQRKTLSLSQCIILFDFKENIKVGEGPRETGRDFYGKSQRSVLGFVVYFKQNGEIKQRFYHFVSEILSHDGLFVRDCINQLLDLEFFRRFNEIFFWTDCGPHFRNFEVLNHTLFEVPCKFDVFTTHNYFGEKHGKGPCDSEFSVLTQWLSEITSHTRIQTTAALLTALRNKSKENVSIGGLNRVFIQYARDARPPHCHHAKFEGLLSFHQLRKAGANTVACKVSDTSNKVNIVQVSKRTVKDKRKDKVAPQVRVQYEQPGPKTMAAWRNALQHL